MYKDTITLFNYHAGNWYATTLTGVDLNADRAAMLTRMGAETQDKARLHLRYSVVSGAILVNNLTVVEPRAYAGDPDTITFRGGETGETPDFFIAEEWPGASVLSDANYADGVMDYIAGLYDVYVISSVARYSVIPHFEITAR